jgi:hypothetical protein
LLQVGGDRRADVGWQGQAVLGAGLAAHNDLAGAPVDVVEAKRGDLGGAQPEPHQQHQDRVVAPAHRVPPIAAG